MTTRAGRVFRMLGAVTVVAALLIGGAETAVSHDSASPAAVGIVHGARLARAGSVGDEVVPASVTVGDISRDYLLGGAPVIAGAERPLLLLFHGLDQDTPSFLGDVNILAAAARAGVVVAAPISPDNAWNDGRFGPDGPDDDSFGMAIVSSLEAAGAIDASRVTVAGFSNGAGMAIELASRHPSSFAALVSVDGELLSGPGATLPSGPVPAFFIHGTADAIQPIGGRPFESDRKPGYVSEQATIANFLAADGELGVSPRRVTAPRHRGVNVGPVTVTQWAGAGPAPVTYASVAGMGHRWPAMSCGALTPVAPNSPRIRGARPAAAKRQAALRKGALKAAEADRAAFAAMLPSAGVSGCETGGGPDVRSTDLSADGLVLGVAASAHAGSDTL